MNDQELLGDHAQNGSEDAFAALVRKHIDLVYTAAMRKVVDPHLAQDVTQSVFLALARGAPKLQGCAVLSGWLHRTTRNLAAMTVRGEVRRRVRESEAAFMNQDSEPKAAWQEIAPQLDDALERLSSIDRDALLLRYFQHQTAREIGQLLGLSEEATQKRLVRSLDQLRRTLLGRGVNVPGSALAGALSVEAVHSAPAALAGSVITTSLASSASFSTSSIPALMASTKFTLVTAAALVAGSAVLITTQHQSNVRLRAELAAREAQVVRTEPTTTNLVDPEELASLRNDRTELLRLRGEISTLRQQHQQRLAINAQRQSSSAKSTPADFVPSADWKEVGADTPEHAFESFLAVLKTGDLTRIESAIHWDLLLKDDLSDDDRSMLDKSKNDYLEMLQRAPTKLSGFDFAPVSENATNSTRVFFQVLTANGTQTSSSFEMVQLESQWKPVIHLGWRSYKDASSFFTSAMFGPEIDLGR